MAHLSIQLPDDVLALARTRAAEVGYASVEDYIGALIRADADNVADNDYDDLGGPPHLSFRSDEELEALLNSRLDDERPSIEATPEFWRDLKRRALGQRGGQD